MNTKHLSTIVLTILLTFIGYSQTATIKGVILDEQNKADWDTLFSNDTTAYDKYNTNMALLRFNKISCSTNENKYGEKWLRKY